MGADLFVQALRQLLPEVFCTLDVDARVSYSRQYVYAAPVEEQTDNGTEVRFRHQSCTPPWNWDACCVKTLVQVDRTPH